MTVDLAPAVRQLLGDAASAEQVAARAAAACVQLTHHLERLVGEAGTQALLERSLVLASAQLAWLPRPVRGEDACAAFHRTLEQHAPQAAAEGFAVVLSTFVGLLQRLVGEGLVQRLLHEVWPQVFPDAAKESQ